MSTATAVPQKFPPMAAPKKPAISEAEQQRRASYVASANGHSAMEGQFGSPLLDSLQARYVAGEISSQDAIHELNKRYGLA